LANKALEEDCTAGKGTALANHEDKQKIHDKQIINLRILNDVHSFTPIV
jgi:hypothetical protein